MSLDAGARRVLELGRAANDPPFEVGTPAAARAACNASFPMLQGHKVAVAAIRERQIDGPNGPITLRIYRGLGAQEAGAPAVVYFHGGGWVTGNLDSHDEVCRWFADLAGAVVVCPDYRLAPEHRFPAGLNDCLATLVFVVNEAINLGIDPARVAVAGDSAGGNLATVVALQSREAGLPDVAAQLLIYPNTDMAQTADSYRRFGKDFGLTTTTMAWLRDQYIRDEADITDPRISPLRAENLSGAPPAFVAIAGHDILADEGTAYAEKLAASGVPVVMRSWPDQIHGFVSMGRYIPAALDVVAAAVDAWKAFERNS